MNDGLTKDDIGELTGIAMRLSNCGWQKEAERISRISRKAEETLNQIERMDDDGR